MSGQQQTGRRTRVLGGLTLGALAAITAVISYQHGLEVVRATGTSGFVAYLVPVVADLMIFASSLALLDAAQRDQPRPPLAACSLAFGIVATVAMNVASGWHHGVGGALVSALAPVALVLSYETLMGMVRRGRQIAETEPPEATAEQPPACPHGVAQGVEEAALAAFLHARDCEGARPSQRQVAEAFGINRNRLGTLIREHDQPPPAEEEGAQITSTPEGQAVEVAT